MGREERGGGGCLEVDGWEEGGELDAVSGPGLHPAADGPVAVLGEHHHVALHQVRQLPWVKGFDHGLLPGGPVAAAAENSGQKLARARAVGVGARDRERERERGISREENK